MRRLPCCRDGLAAGGTNSQPTKGAAMIFGKLWHSLMAQINKIANIFWSADPIAQMQYEYDQAVAQLKDGREGLERYRALVERVTQQVAADKQHVAKLEAQVKAYLTAGDRDTAARFALELQKAKTTAGRERRAVETARRGLRQQRHQDQARQRQAGRRPQQDPEVRRRPENEPRRGRNGQAGRRVQLRRDAPTSARSSR